MKKSLVLGLLLLLATSVVASSKTQVPPKSRFEKLELFNKVLFMIESQYYRGVDTDKLIQGAIKGMMNTLDPHSAFLDKEIYRKMQEDTRGEFGGLGIEVSQKEGVIYVTTPIDDTPAFKAGIKAGDRIIEINHESIVGITLEKAVEKMRGKPKSKITIGILRDGFDGIKHIDIVRKIIKINAVKGEIIEKNYIYIRLTQFQKDSGKNISKKIKKLKRRAKKSGGVKGIILDLRSNPGGLLREAVNVSSIFLNKGIVVSTEERDPKRKEIHYVKKTTHKELKLPLVVLINGSSASASEIVAGALQDNKRAIIMGVQSFGKGSVQQVVQVDKENGIKLTIAQYMTPSGKKIQAVGIVPDINVSDYEGRWAEENKIDSTYIRESDLRNHLTATIETPAEKKLRKVKEKNKRKMRMARIKKIREANKKNKSNKNKKISSRRYSPKEDYQVVQAINYIKSFKVYKSLDY